MTKTLRYSFIIIILSTFVSLTAADYLIGKYQQYIAKSSNINPGFLRYHAALGWTLNPNWQGRHQHHDFDVNYHTNILGYRGSLQTFTNKKTKTVLVGDSFTFGLGVNDDDTFSHLLNQSQPGSFLNLGIPGYSTDQQWLLIQDVSPIFNAKHYLLFFYLGNDFIDNTLSYPLQASLAKPLFQLQSGKLILSDQAITKQPKTDQASSFSMKEIIDSDEQQPWLQTLAKHSRLLSLLIEPSINTKNVDQQLKQKLSYHRDLAKALLSEINTHLQQQNIAFTIATIPNKTFILNPNSASGVLQNYVRKELIDIGSETGIPVYDLAQKMKQAHQQDNSSVWFHPNEGHLNTEGHKVVAKMLNEAF